jgi:2'-5' RNA ligase
MANGRAARVFVGVKLAAEMAHELGRMARELEGPGVRLVANGDLHLTLVAPWNEASPSAAIATMRQAVAGCPAFALTIQHVGYGPDPKRPRFLWADCAPSAELAALRAGLLGSFGQTDDRPFRPHVTLARIRANGRAVARRHPIDRAVSFIGRIESVELFQSPRTGESGYRVLASARLGELST